MSARKLLAALAAIVAITLGVMACAPIAGAVPPPGTEAVGGWVQGQGCTWHLNVDWYPGWWHLNADSHPLAEGGSPSCAGNSVELTGITAWVTPRVTAGSFYSAVGRLYLEGPAPVRFSPDVTERGYNEGEGLVRNPGMVAVGLGDPFGFTRVRATATKVAGTGQIILG